MILNDSPIFLLARKETYSRQNFLDTGLDLHLEEVAKTVLQRIMYLDMYFTPSALAAV